MTSKMSELQEAMNRYGETSLRNDQTIHPIGERLIEGFDAYLGVPGCISGVPPTGDWEEPNADYCDAKFSTYRPGPLAVGPISMGLALRIPHTKDDGAFWMRQGEEMSADRLRELNERIAELFRDDWPISTRAEPPPGTSVDPPTIDKAVSKPA